MPIYEYECEKGHSFDRLLKLDDYKQPQTCDCGAKSRKIITPTMLNCDIAPWDSYISPASGKLITSYKERERDMKATNCVDYDPGMKDVQKNKIASDEKAIEDKVDRTVEMEIDKMSANKREKLGNEMVASNIEVVRQ